MEDSGRLPNGKFAPGHSGFKKPGSEFQRTTRQKLGEFLESKLPELGTIYNDLSSKEKVRLILSLSEYFLPKQRELFVELEQVGLDVQKLDLTKLSPAALDELLTLASND